MDGTKREHDLVTICIYIICLSLFIELREEMNIFRFVHLRFERR